MRLGKQGIIGGDFNMILSRTKRLGDEFSTSCAQDFQDKIFIVELADLPPMGSKWTWSNQRNSLSFSRIDCLLPGCYRPYSYCSRSMSKGSLSSNL